MEKAVLEKLNIARNARIGCVLVTNLANGETELITEDKVSDGPLSEAVIKTLRTGKSMTVGAGDEEYFLNAHLPPPRIVVIGAVHISQAMAPIAKLAGYDLEVIDPRTAFATPERFEGTQVFAEWPEDILAIRPLDAYCALAAVTHDPKIDDFPIAEALRRECFYIGALGSRKTHAKRVERLLAEGVNQERINKIHAPIGLDIGAASPQEIAVAVMAEIIEAFRKRGLGLET
jgi:xanthine dehydrogenase accessory factor